MEKYSATLSGVLIYSIFLLSRATREGIQNFKKSRNQDNEREKERERIIAYKCFSFIQQEAIK